MATAPAFGTGRAELIRAAEHLRTQLRNATCVVDGWDREAAAQRQAALARATWSQVSDCRPVLVGTAVLVTTANCPWHYLLHRF